MYVLLAFTLSKTSRLIVEKNEKAEAVVDSLYNKQKLEVQQVKMVE